mmetsp:Transcript_39662/g.71167  ORF Transcript_39662/g.71167 Transcript_39662/m.71167 type:complete len:127 (-) Transcript_39662:944-1324(-)
MSTMRSTLLATPTPLAMMTALATSVCNFSTTLQLILLDVAVTIAVILSVGQEKSSQSPTPPVSLFGCFQQNQLIREHWLASSGTSMSTDTVPEPISPRWLNNNLATRTHSAQRRSPPLAPSALLWE